MVRAVLLVQCMHHYFRSCLAALHWLVVGVQGWGGSFAGWVALPHLLVDTTVGIFSNVLSKMRNFPSSLYRTNGGCVD